MHNNHIVALAICAVVLCLGIIALEGPNKETTTSPIVKEYEDHSAKIKIGPTICVVPAFDSPEDEIKCQVNN